ncbi:MAG: hexokinase [Dysgonamonadaceae bacterium]|jgi:hexokinase|nr:hexokinase [Dysgonamonadaceae bacterium]
MKQNIFDLTTAELKKIADSLQGKIEEGLKKDGMEISDIPTHIHPKKDIQDGKVLVLDWGGTNFRAAVVAFKDGKATILESLKRPLSAKETVGFEQDTLHEKMAEWISELKTLDSQVTQIGYCFSYPAASRINGDAILLRWTKGIEIPDMLEKPVGESLLRYLNSHRSIHTEFKDIKVINDTVACLFAGLSETGYDSYMGLIVGTGTNMASLMRLDKIEKLNNKEQSLIPVNLESGNFFPPYLTVIDGLVDAMSNNKGSQRFEKAISGGYLGELFKTVFQHEKVKYDFDGGDLANMINNPEQFPEDQVKVARWIYDRSAKLVAASLAGLAQVLTAQDPSIKNIGLAADGSVFWGKDRDKQPYYKELVSKELQLLLPAGVSITIFDEMSEPNLIGSAIAALS